MDPYAPAPRSSARPFRAAERLLACTLLALVAGCGGDVGGSVGGGNGGSGGTGGGSGELSIPGGLDTAAPTIVHVTPSNGTRTAGTNSRLAITFSEPMREASLGTAIRLVDVATGTPVALKPIDYDIANNLATVTPQSLLDADREYRASISTAATDLSGKGLAADHEWTFTTAAVPDTTPPTVSSHTPASGQSGVAAGSAVAMAFSEPMDAASVAAGFALSSGGTPVAGTLAYIGQAAVFTPAAALAPQTTYVATLRRTATDLAGNGLPADYVWAFTTGSAADTTPPTVLQVSPAPGATNVAHGTALQVTFSEPIYPFLYGTVDGATVDVLLDYTANTATLIPTAALRANATYTANVSARDLAGNPMVEPYRWEFVTAP